MKKIFFIGVSLAIATLFFSCKAEPQLDAIPDLVFKADIGGTRTIDFTLPMGTADTRAVNGTFVSPSNLITLNAMDNLKWNLVVSVSATEFSEGTYTLNGGGAEVFAFNDIETGKNYQSKTGSITFSKVELYQNVGSSLGGADTYYVEGSFSGTLEEIGSNPTVEISVSGSFKGIPYSVN